MPFNTLQDLVTTVEGLETSVDDLQTTVENQKSFGTISVAGQSNVVADGATNTLTLVAGANVAITTDATTDAITIAAAEAGGIVDGDKGDITVSASGATWTIDAEAITTSKILNANVTYAKIQNVTSTDKILGRLSAGAGTIEEITCTAAGRALIDDVDAAAQRTTLGLGTLATQSGTFSGTSSGTNTGDQTITLTGDVTGSGTGSFSATLANSGATAGTYRSVTVDVKGRVTSGTNPTTISGYGITDAVTTSGDQSISGVKTFSTALAVGVNPASSGYLRIPNNQFINARNAANTGDINVIGVNTSNQVVFGTGLSLGDQSITNVYSISQTNSSNWNISNAGVATFASSVGIGTTTPSNTLDVIKNANDANRIFVANDDTGSSAISSIRFRTGGTAGSISAVEQYGVNSVGGERMRITAGSAGPMIFTTANLERMRITSSGDVGIGTTGPTAKLSVVSTGQVHIGDTIQSLHTGTDNNGAIYFGGAANNALVPTAGIEASWANASNPQIHVGITRDGNKTRIGCFYDQTIRFYTGNIERAIFHPAGHFYPQTDNANTCGASGKRWASLWAANGTIQTSDEREKNTITDSVLGLDFIQSLRPVSYKWNVGGNEVELERDSDGNTIPGPDGADKTITTSKPGTRTHWGLIAQEVKAAVDASGVDFGGWVLSDKDDPDSQQALRYDQFIAPLIKAVQELSAKVEELEARLPQN